MSRARRPTLLDKVIEHIDQRIKWLQLERAELLELQASETARASRRSTPGTTRLAGTTRIVAAPEKP